MKQVKLSEKEKNMTPLEWKIKMRQRVTASLISGVLIGIGSMIFILAIAMLAL